MLGWFKKKQRSSPPEGDVRDLLFGDVPLKRWAASSASDEPWAKFAAAARCLDERDQSGATTILLEVARTSGLEARHHLQAWHFLRQLGTKPAAEVAKRVYGVVVEVHLDAGVDVVAAYSDHSARYLNHSGAAIVWDIDDPSMNQHIDNLLAVGSMIVAVIGPWEGDRPPAPARGNVRINMLTPSGLHFGEGPFEVMQQEPMAAPAIAAALSLMQALLERVDAGAAPNSMSVRRTQT
jgi:hypothetical protein